MMQRLSLTFLSFITSLLPPVPVALALLFPVLLTFRVALTLLLALLLLLLLLIATYVFYPEGKTQNNTPVSCHKVGR